MKVNTQSHVVTSDLTIQALIELRPDINRNIACVGKEVTKLTVSKIKDDDRYDTHTIDKSDLYRLEVRVSPKSKSVNSEIVNSITNNISRNKPAPIQSSGSNDEYSDKVNYSEENETFLEKMVSGLISLNSFISNDMIESSIHHMHPKLDTNNIVDVITNIKKQRLSV